LHPDVGYLDLGTGPAGAVGLYICFLSPLRGSVWRGGKGGWDSRRWSNPSWHKKPLWQASWDWAGGQGFTKFYYCEPL